VSHEGHDPTEPLFEHLVRALVDRLSDGVLVTRRDGTIIWASQSMETLLGIPPESLIGTNAQALLHPDDAELSRFRDPDLPVAERPIWHETRRIRHADGSYRLVDRSAVDLTDDPAVRGWGVILRRYSPRFQAFENERRLAATVEHTQDIVLVYGTGLELLYASPSSRQLAERLDGTLVDHLDRYVDPRDREVAGKTLERLLAAPGSQIEDRLRLRPADGRLVWVDMRAVNLLDDPEVRAIVLNGREVTEQVALEARLRHDALHDPLTGLPNRPQVMALLETALADDARDGTTAVLYLDLDRFKVVNDSFGHATGDRVLVELATRLRVALGDLATVGRFGGDEYVVVASVAGTEDAVALAEIVARQAVQPFTVHGPEDEQAEVYLSASIGIALSAHSVDASAMLHHADAAMYRAKADGRGGWEIYDEGMRAAARARLSMETELARALDDGAFELHYQPIIDVRSRRVTGFEALARWRLADGRAVAPLDFIPVAEETGGIHRLGAWALAEACRQLHAWEGTRVGPLSMSVNVSPGQLSDLGLARHVGRALSSASIDPALLCLEITETVLVDDLERAVSAIMRLRDLGVRLALDDFGTGWSSLTHLRSVPVDVVKIDKSFVDGLTEGGDDRAIVGAVVTMCRALGKTVVAEGVETEAQFLVTRELGCTHAQGYLVARPLPAGDVPDWLQRYRDDGNRRLD
jgi:diguanylate cyclase (GGDEF)-like protein/PAS domain S-box-containing protein